MDNLETFTCDKYGTTMLAAGAKEFCAKRYAAAVSGKPLRFDADGCGECARGKLFHDIKKGETTMVKEIHKNCDKHGAFITTGPAGKCPECKAEGGTKKTSSAKNTKSAKKKTGRGLKRSVVGGGGRINQPGPFEVSRAPGAYRREGARGV
jgi:hypothetical protein